MIDSTILNYRILSKIGEGGMGTVYLGSHITLERKVAIKALLPEFAANQQIRERFINEAKTLSKLNHQNIVTLYDFADIDNKLLLIMEYIEGTPLDTVIEKVTGAIPEPRCAKIFEQVLAGFSYAHRKGIVHRDIKPSNIILQPDDTPKILDFGIAKIVEGDMKLTRTGTRMGSVVYMSPEQVMGRDVDYRSDIYSLGITLFEMLSGRLPYDTTTESEFDIQNKIVRETLKSVCSLNSDVSEHVENVIYKATAKEPTQRFQSCDEFSVALGDVAPISKPDHQTTVYQAPPFSPRTQIQTGISPARKSRLPVYLMGGLGVLILLIILFVFVFNRDNSNVVVSKDDGKKNGVVASNEERNQVERTVRSWLNCWQSKDVACFTNYITTDYQYETATGKKKFQNYYERVEVLKGQFSERKYIDISAQDMQIELTSPGFARVSYYQIYNSDKYQDSGTKILYLKKVGNEWKIYKDTFH